MDDLNEKIKRDLRRIVDAPRLVSGTVLEGSYNGADGTISVELWTDNAGVKTEGVLVGVKLMAADGFWMVPAAGSVVLLMPLDGGGYVVVRCGLLRQFYVNVEGKGIDVTADDGVVVNGGSNGGVPIAGNVATKLNALENDLNTIKAVFTAWVPVANDGGAALKAASTAWAGSSLDLTLSGDIENVDFKQ